MLPSWWTGLAGISPSGSWSRPTSPCAASGQGTRVEPGREHLAVPAGQLVVQPHLHLLPRHPRPLLRGVEQTHGPALAHHVHRPARLGSPVLINGTWYKLCIAASSVAYRCCCPPWAFPPRLGPPSGAAPFLVIRSM